MATGLQVEIELAEDAPRAVRAAALLRDLLARHDLTRYLFTARVRIAPGVVPHSHPVLTLNARHVDDPDRFLSVFLHEQVHWHLAARPEATAAAIAAFRERYPVLPDDPRQVAACERATYLHFAVNALELRLLARVLGAERARTVLKGADVYPWIYATVLRDTAAIDAVLDGCGLTLR